MTYRFTVTARHRDLPGTYTLRRKVPGESWRDAEGKLRVRLAMSRYLVIRVEWRVG